MLILLLMKFPIHMMILTSILAVSACSGPQETSSARAAYGDAVPEFRATKKKNQKREKKALKEAKRKNAGNNNNKSYFEGRPY
jgi:hypothetical protein